MQHREETRSVLCSLSNVSALNTVETYYYILLQFVITPYRNNDPLMFILMLPFPGQCPVASLLELPLMWLSGSYTLGNLPSSNILMCSLQYIDYRMQNYSISPKENAFTSPNYLVRIGEQWWLWQKQTTYFFCLLSKFDVLLTHLTNSSQGNSSTDQQLVLLLLLLRTFSL